MLQIKKCKFGYTNGPYFKSDFQVESGQLVYIKGPNGSGKSTLLRTICGILQPFSGQIYWNQQDITSYKIAERPVTMMFSGENLFPGLTALHNLLIVPGVQKSDVEKLLKEFDLQKQGDLYPHQLSRGQQQAFAFLRCILQNSPLWLLDEPSSSLSEPFALQFIHWIQNNYRTHHTTLLVVSHQESLWKPYADDCREIGSIVQFLEE